MSTITRKSFINELSANHGVVDTNNMSKDLKKAFANAGISEADVKKMAGPDGQIKGEKEFNALFRAVDMYDRKETPNSFESEYIINKGTCGEQYAKNLPGEVYDALKKEVDRNRLEARYSKPGVQ